MYHVEKEFELSKVLITYGQTTSLHNYCKFDNDKQYVKMAVLTELQHKSYIIKSMNVL